MIRTDPGLRLHIIALFVLVVVCAGVFSNSLGNSFVWDDQEVLVEDRYLQNIRYIPSLFSPAYWRNITYRTKGIYRPVVAASFAADFAVWKTDPMGYHLTNLILHTTCTLLFYTLMCLLAAERKTRSGLPLMSALLFAAHPVHVEAVSWVKNRSDLLAGVLFIISLICFIQALRQKRPLSRWGSYAGSLAFYIFALASKQSALALPLVLLLYIVCFIPRGRRRLPSGMTAPFFIISGAFLLFKITALDMLSPRQLPPPPEIGLYSNILAVPVTLWYYLRLLLVPVNLTAEHLFTPPGSLLAPDVLFSISALLAIGAAALWSFKKKRIFFFAVFWILLTLLPVSNILYLHGRPIAEQRLYLPSMGFCMLLGSCLIGARRLGEKYLGRRTSQAAAAGIFLIILSLYCVITFDRNRDWKDPVTFWKDVIRKSPHSARAYNNLGVVYSSSGETEKAIHLFEKALEIDGSYENPLNNLGVLYGAQGNIPAAIKQFKKALAINPFNMNSYVNLANAYYVSGRTEQALRLYKRSLDLNPYRAKAYDNLATIYDNLGMHREALELHRNQLKYAPYSSEILTNLGQAYMALGQYPEAAAALRKALKNDPSNATACSDLGILAGLRGNNMESVALLERSLRLDPDNAQNLVNLGISYQNMDEIDRAVLAYEKAIEIAPEFPDAYNNLGVLYGMRGRDEEAMEYFLKAVSLDPDDPNAYVNIARVHNSRGNVGKAMFSMKKAAELDPDNTPVYLALLKEYQDAVSKYEGAFRDDPENTKALFALGTVHYNAGQYDKALEAYSRLLEIDPEHARAWYAVSLVYFSMEEYEKAAEYADKAKTLGLADPRYLEALKARIEQR